MKGVHQGDTLAARRVRRDSRGSVFDRWQAAPTDLVNASAPCAASMQVHPGALSEEPTGIHGERWPFSAPRRLPSVSPRRSHPATDDHGMVAPPSLGPAAESEEQPIPTSSPTGTSEKADSDSPPLLACRFTIVSVEEDAFQAASLPPLPHASVAPEPPIYPAWDTTHTAISKGGVAPHGGKGLRLPLMLSAALDEELQLFSSNRHAEPVGPAQQGTRLTAEDCHPIAGGRQSSTETVHEESKAPPDQANGEKPDLPAVMEQELRSNGHGMEGSPAHATPTAPPSPKSNGTIIQTLVTPPSDETREATELILRMALVVKGPNVTDEIVRVPTQRSASARPVSPRLLAPTAASRSRSWDRTVAARPHETNCSQEGIHTFAFGKCTKCLCIESWKKSSPATFGIKKSSTPASSRLGNVERQPTADSAWYSFEHSCEDNARLIDVRREISRETAIWHRLRHDDKQIQPLEPPRAGQADPDARGRKAW
jgi:hypothetical protein